MARDLRGIDWINHRPITEYQLAMIDMNLPLEHQFVKAYVAECYHAQTSSSPTCTPRSPTTPQCVVRKMESLFTDFLMWATSTMNAGASRLANMNSKKFGLKMSKLVWSADLNTIGFQGLTKARNGSGVAYTFDIPKLAREMVEKRWASPDEFPAPLAFHPEAAAAAAAAAADIS